MKSKEEYWDESSEIIDTDIDSLQRFAGTNVATKSKFLSALDGFAAQEATTFAEFISQYALPRLSGLWTVRGANKPLTSKELYKLYIQSK